MPLDTPSVIVVIPARYESSRFPGKPLALLAGKPLIQHVCEAVMDVPRVMDVRVVTDDGRILQAVEEFGGHAILVDDACRTGSDRVAKVAEQLKCDTVVNLQADEIPLQPSLLSDLIEPFLESDAEMGTLKRKLQTVEELHDTSLVKVVTDSQGDALYFSRAQIPFVRDHDAHDVLSGCYYGHLGIYIFRRETLLRFATLETGVLEEAEKLEQLRALEHGISIRVWETRHLSLRIDRPEDLETASRQLKERAHGVLYSHSSVSTS